MLEKVFRKKMTVQGSSDGQAFVRNVVTKITVFFVSVISDIQTNYRYESKRNKIKK